jgi:hypothetical protein
MKSLNLPRTISPELLLYWQRTAGNQAILRRFLAEDREDDGQDGEADVQEGINEGMLAVAESKTSHRPGRWTTAGFILRVVATIGFIVGIVVLLSLGFGDSR